MIQQAVYRIQGELAALSAFYRFQYTALRHN